MARCTAPASAAGLVAAVAVRVLLLTLPAGNAFSLELQPWRVSCRDDGALRLRGGLTASLWETRLQLNRDTEGSLNWRGGVELGDRSGRWRWLTGNLAVTTGSGALCHTGFGRVALDKATGYRLRLSTSSFSLPGSGISRELSGGRVMLALLNYPESSTRGFSGWNLLLAADQRWHEWRWHCYALRTLNADAETALSFGSSWRAWQLELTGGDVGSWLLSRNWRWHPLRLTAAIWGLQRSPPGRWLFYTGPGRRSTGILQQIEQRKGRWRWQGRLQLWQIQDDDAPLLTQRARVDWQLERRFRHLQLRLRQRLAGESNWRADFLTLQLRGRTGSGWLTGSLTHLGSSRYLWQLRLDRNSWSVQLRTSLGSSGSAAGSGLALPGTIQWSWLQQDQLELRLRYRRQLWHSQCDLLCGYRLVQEETSYSSDSGSTAVINWGLQLSGR